MQIVMTILVVVAIAGILIYASTLPIEVCSPPAKPRKPSIYEDPTLQSAIGDMEPLEETKPC